MREHVDVIVVGAGPAGSALAQRLAQRGCAVALLERTRFDTARVGESLGPAVRPLLAELDVWESFRRLGPLPSYGTRSVWGSEEIDEQSHLASPYGCGWHVDRVSFDRMLADAAAGAGADLRCETSVADRQESPHGGWILSLDSPTGVGRRQMRADMVVDATGRFAHEARRSGAMRLILDRLVAVATLFRGIDVTNEGFVLVETAPEGWWYSAPVPPDGLITMLMTDSDLAHGNASSLGERWAAALARTKATRQRTRGERAWGPRAFSAQSHRLRRSDLDRRWLAVGDAALAVDPVAGNGVVRALRSAAAASDAIVATLDGSSCDAVATYEARQDDECTTYLRERLLYYEVEQRWCDTPFWARRLQAAASVHRTGEVDLEVHDSGGVMRARR
jgi:flavin-dependent dehydrogenase